jgi:hypothetical protein
MSRLTPQDTRSHVMDPYEVLDSTAAGSRSDLGSSGILPRHSLLYKSRTFPRSHTLTVCSILQYKYSLYFVTATQLLLHLASCIPALPCVTTYYALAVDPRKYLKYLHVTIDYKINLGNLESDSENESGPDLE